MSETIKKLYAENAKLKAEVELQRKEIIAESARTAQEKLRADQLDKQHSMQAAMHKQANEEVVLLKSMLEQREALIKELLSALTTDTSKPVDPIQQGMGARDAAFEAVRKAFCKLQRYSFFLDSLGNVRRCADHCGNWVEFEAVHTLFEPQSVDAAIAAQAKQGEHRHENQRSYKEQTPTER